MRFSAALVAAIFLPVVINAEHGYPPAPPRETGTDPQFLTAPGATSTAPPEVPASNSTNINVLVAPGGQFTYSPSNFTASNGTVVTFFFPWAVAHSVTQGSFTNPCVYLAATDENPAGFDSALQTGKQFSIKITNDQEPIWFFCKAGRHCNLGMVGAINAPTSGNTFDAYLAAAKALGSTSSQPPFTDNITVTSGVAAVVTGAPLSQPPRTGLSTHLVADSFVTLLAAVFGITLG